jgi:hypothetical protein
MTESITQYYRCPERYIRFNTKGELSEECGYFRFGPNVVCYGRLSGGSPSVIPSGNLSDAMDRVVAQNGTIFLPFDAAEVVDNLRHESYAKTSRHNNAWQLWVLNNIYYLIRPLMPVTVRKHLQKAWLTDWRKLQFPIWPVDRTVDNLFDRLLLLSIRTQGVERIPFIWFWPYGASSCAVVTHDVETVAGRDFCSSLMDADNAHGIKASFAVVPESRYEVRSEFLKSILDRGFEVIIHDLNHDGHLFRDREEYLARVEKINAYGSRFAASGFRAAVLYRNQSWFDSLKFSYDTSVPNVAHLDPQRGGCCTVMPYFIGDIVELPVTTTQDYALFNYLNEYSTRLWERQIALIMEQHGLVNLIVHPDFIAGTREWKVSKPTSTPRLLTR